MLKKRPRPKRVLQYSSIWLTIYADIITNLTLFFLMSYAFTRLDAAKRADIQSTLSSFVNKNAAVQERANRVLKQLQEQQTMSKLDLEKSNLQQYAKLEVNEKMIRIFLTAPVLFDAGDSALKKEAMAGLDEIANSLRNLPNDIIVEGHTDNIPVTGGKYSSNWELSVARAVSVINYFIKVKSFPSQKFIAAGYGEYRPLYPNDTPLNRSQNRRIEINVIR